MPCEIISAPYGVKFTPEQQRCREIFEFYFETEYLTRKAEMDPMIARLEAMNAEEARCGIDHMGLTR